MSYVLEREDGLDYVAHLDGVSWYDAGKEFRALPRRKRLLHRHSAQTRAIYHGNYLERCICGAYGFGRGYWTMKL